MGAAVAEVSTATRALRVAVSSCISLLTVAFLIWLLAVAVPTAGRAATRAAPFHCVPASAVSRIVGPHLTFRRGDPLYPCGYDLDRGPGLTSAWSISLGPEKPPTVSLPGLERDVKKQGYLTTRHITGLGHGAFEGRSVDELTCFVWFRGKSGETLWVDVDAQLGVSQNRMCKVAAKVAQLYR
jgi:hypothetical protein